MQMFSTQEDGRKFTYWEEYLVLWDSPKFRAICEEETAPGPKRTRLGRADNYNSSSGSRHFDLNDEVEEQSPSRHYPSAHGPRDSSRQSEPLDPPPNNLLQAGLYPTPPDRLVWR